MKKKNYLLFIIISTLFFFNCKDKQKTELNPQWSYEYIKGYGESKKSAYTFCGIIPKIINYEYKVGTWAFYSPQKVKIAEGTFDAELVKIDAHGGCSYSYYKSTANPEKWKFWDSNGKSIFINKRDLDFISTY